MKKSILFCILAALVLLGACGRDNGDNGQVAREPGVPGVPTEIDHSRHETFSLWLFSTPNDFYAVYDDNPIVQYLNNRFNVTLTFEQPVVGTESDSLSLMFGTGQWTDMIEMSFFTGSIQQLFDDGVIIDIAEYLHYMPNFSAIIDAYPEARRYLFDDNGRMLVLSPISTGGVQAAWGGLAYRHDILEIMTGGNVHFPSGYHTPTTVEDWEYMLPLFQAFFEMAGFPESAPLIIPFNGYFPLGELGAGFGFPGFRYYVDTTTGVVNNGMFSHGLFNYLQTMNRWFEAGWIDRDFASRVGDMFFLPATHLTFGGAAGIFYAIGDFLGDTMSMPEHGLYVDLRPMRTPLAEGMTMDRVLNWHLSGFDESFGYVITRQTQNIPRLLSIIDFLYSEEGSLIATLGLPRELIPEGCRIHAAHGLEDGLWWRENGEIVLNPLAGTIGGPIEVGHLAAMRLPRWTRNDIDMAISRQWHIDNGLFWADDYWAYQDSVTTIRVLGGTSLTAEEEIFISDMHVRVMDYVDSMLPRFIMGMEPLTEESFNAFLDQLRAFGLAEGVAIHQRAFDRTLGN